MEKVDYIQLIIQELSKLRNLFQTMTTEEVEARIEQLEACLIELS